MYLEKNEYVLALPFVFSNERRWRWIRHLSFWASWLLFQLFLYSFTPSPLLIGQSFWMRLYLTLPEAVLFLFPQAFLAYALMYFVIPRLVIPAKYIRAMTASLLLILLTAVFAAIMSVTVIDQVRYVMSHSVSPIVARNPHTPEKIAIGVAMLAGLRGAVTVGGIAAAIKLMKCFYEKQQSALLLEKEKINAELQMLKAQLHPHFLFNTLNNIYSLTQDGSDRASGMIVRLSAILRYILYEANRSMVPLEKELQLLNDYVQLETLRYDQSLDLSIRMPKNTTHIIAPLLLLPFIENAFKHGASGMLERPWVNLTIELNDHTLSMKVVNGRDEQSRSPEGGIGITNVRKRLELLYPQKHTLLIEKEAELFFVNLRIELDNNAFNE